MNDLGQQSGTTAGQVDWPAIARWAVREGMAGAPIARLIEGLCQQMQDAGVPVLRAFLGVQALHPLYGGYSFVWRRREDEVEQGGYLRNAGRNPDFLSSPFHHMYEQRELRLRQGLETEAEREFPIYQTFRAEGGTDYYARILPFLRPDGEAGEDGVVTSFLFDPPGGMNDDDVAELDRVLEVFALAVRSASTQETATNVAQTYLGRDAGKRVLDGDIQRGTVNSMRAVIYFADLRGFTALADRLPSGELLSMLDGYLEAIAGPVLERGGEVLKFLGDGVLAVFEIDGERADECQVACLQSLAAARAAFAAMADLNGERQANGQPVLDLDLALHVGDVAYGNVGAETRLDFTVIGGAVNEAARIEALCRELGESLLISDSFRQAMIGCGEVLRPVGSHRLRDLPGERPLYALASDRPGAAAP
ncbi:MAG: adenylate/guanylate cyclase domain-containing protein [Alphaproteobacteria bacterium]|jgi:adenylate cyclase|nr:adenylate/guanylate cyclase domain-containing protein [Alphaproteobacteria bacterium]MDP6567641.1 adenylate/guanylate cyclase domain-containing protein [Alphaproteobacteria bacterium]MDP6813223.1 adenylate/guanylate cyclase domain-containing protein [Alphaproteobacteria bacterium]